MLLCCQGSTSGNIQEETDYTQIQYLIYTLWLESFVLFLFVDWTKVATAQLSISSFMIQFQ